MKIKNLAFLPVMLLTRAGVLSSSFLGAQNSTVTRSLASFDQIGISGGFDVILLKQGEAESVTLEVTGIDPDNITTEAKEGKLKIKTKKGNYSNYKAKITVTYRNLKSVGTAVRAILKPFHPSRQTRFPAARSFVIRSFVIGVICHWGHWGH